MSYRTMVAVVLGLLLARAGTSWGGCPNLCTISHESPALEPPLDCLSIEVSENDCDCGLHLSFKNRCADDLVASGFVFTTCGNYGGGSADVRGKCSVLKAGEDGVLLLSADRAEGTGRKVHALHLRGPAGETVVTASFTVGEFRQNSGVGCASVAGPGHTTTAVLAVTAWLIVRRRAGRRSRSPASRATC
jgi:hypothetical protein